MQFQDNELSYRESSGEYTRDQIERQRRRVEARRKEFRDDVRKARIKQERVSPPPKPQGRTGSRSGAPPSATYTPASAALGASSSSVGVINIMPQVTTQGHSSGSRGSSGLFNPGYDELTAHDPYDARNNDRVLELYGEKESPGRLSNPSRRRDEFDSD